MLAAGSNDQTSQRPPACVDKADGPTLLVNFWPDRTIASPLPALALRMPLSTIPDPAVWPPLTALMRCAATPASVILPDVLLAKPAPSRSVRFTEPVPALMLVPGAM